jgi:hypothetical protein
LVAGGEFLTEYFAYQLDRRWDFARSFWVLQSIGA